MFTDSHCHLHDRQFFSADQAEKMLQNAHKNGVEKIICIGTDPADSLAARDFAAAHDNVYWSYGVHPSEASEALLKQLSGCSDSRWSPVTNGLVGVAVRGHPSSDLARNVAEKERTKPVGLVAIGEVGLDYHYEGYDREAQIHLFEEMLQLATDNNLPVSFHIREAFDDFFGVVANFPQVRGVVHSFSDSKKNLKKILNTTDFYVGVNGLATYSTLPTPPLERTLLETDAPFLTPYKKRDIINEPAYIADIANWLSIKLGVPLKTISEQTEQNVRRLFNI